MFHLFLYVYLHAIIFEIIYSISEIAAAARIRDGYRYNTFQRNESINTLSQNIIIAMLFQLYLENKCNNKDFCNTFNN